ncbi:Uncharacterized protein APZ42_022846 [Daphnia magna]|uniref:Uncharacterized protein n=1 Tax=Daphnia magna TaxID=35525 RepID=A0A0P4ZND3_9CRUS|nr:Uncharacterized protein APZ42_022846 [Daphnia magna]
MNKKCSRDLVHVHSWKLPSHQQGLCDCDPHLACRCQQSSLATLQAYYIHTALDCCGMNDEKASGYLRYGIYGEQLPFTKQL